MAAVLLCAKRVENMRASTFMLAVTMRPSTRARFRKKYHHEYTIDHFYEPYKTSAEEIPLRRALHDSDQGRFPSLSKARKAIQYGRLLVLNNNKSIKKANKDQAFMLSCVANETTILQDNDVIATRSRVPNEFYSESCTKYVDPPSTYTDLISMGNPILYEDEHIGVVNKPDNMDTIGKQRCDLQSALPFILYPPYMQSSKARKNIHHECYLPRPIHRLDRRTSGCVLVAKSQVAMKKFSKLFATRQIKKSYCAITFGEPTQQLKNDSSCTKLNGETFYAIDYPIDGKDAITLWRVVLTVKSSTYGTLSLLHLLPKTGRYHQIRRHLSYCLSCPIVGDIKYDRGSQVAKKARKELSSMFLCSNSIEFQHVMLKEEDGDETHKVVSVNIPLPDKYYDLLEIDTDDVVL